MFNKVYNTKSKNISGTNKFGSTFTYANGTYTISGTTQDLTTLSGSNIANTHYTCWNNTGTCSNISYVYYINSTIGAFYIEISDGKNITDAINEMLYNNDVNTNNSSIKGIVDSWYAQNLSTKTNMLEDIVYCNARNMANQSTNGWNSEGGSTSTTMQFKNYTESTTDMTCTNVTDQFAVGNNRAKLIYPVGLLQNEERTNINSSTMMATGVSWWGLSPSYFYDYYAYVRTVNLYGNFNDDVVTFAKGVRPVVSLKSSTVISDGSGSKESPFVIS